MFMVSVSLLKSFIIQILVGEFRDKEERGEKEKIFW